MRLDKYLKVSRLIKRRTVAKDVATAERIEVNGRVAKPATMLKVGDEITLRFGNRILRVEVQILSERVSKGTELYRVLEDTKPSS